jgi:hypothetical protein
MRNVSIWIALFFCGLVGLNWPILEAFGDGVFWYLQGFWLVLVALIGLAARRAAPPPG